MRTTSERGHESQNNEVRGGLQAFPARVLVVGCGGLGGVLMNTWADPALEHLIEPVGLSTNTQIVRAVREQGYRLVSPEGERAVSGRIEQELAPGEPPFDFIVLATQPPAVEDAAKRALEWLAPHGSMVCLQNGLCEDRVAAICGPDRVIGAVVAWGASVVEPGVYDRTSSGGFTVGALTDAGQSRVQDLAVLLETVGPVEVSTNLRGARMSKLAINCAISTLGTIGGERLGVLMRQRFVRRLALEIMTEVVEVARHEGVQLEKVSGTLDLDWMALTESEKRVAGSPGLFAKHAMLLAVGARYRRMRSSMLSAIERGREPAVDFLNGEVVERGAAVKISTPVNARAREIVHEIARGRRESSVETLRALARDVGVLG